MNKKILNHLVQHRSLFVPSLFTDKQVNLIQKYLQRTPLTATERTYLYSTIKRKVSALQSLQQEYYVRGEGMIPERVEAAKKILQELGKPQAFISGSFLYRKEYNDIDVFIIGKKRAAYYQDKKHITIITEKDLHRPLFISTAKYSVATFEAVKEAIPHRAYFDEIMFLYQWLINQLLEGENLKELRDLIFWHYLHVKKELLDARSLEVETQEIKNLNQEGKIKMINSITKELLLGLYSSTYLYNALSRFFQSVKEMAKGYNTANIPIFLNFSREVQHESRRT